VTRVYVASTPSRLRDAVAAGVVGPVPLSANAVTDAVTAELADASEEEWEYAASSAASLASVGMLRDDEPPRRVVLALDVRRTGDGADDDPTVVSIEEELTLDSVAAVLVDTADAESVVAAARDAVSAGDPEADRRLERCLDHELGWWATQEIPTLLDGLLGGR
jgi:Family of unknown function (DUF6912)